MGGKEVREKRGGESQVCYKPLILLFYEQKEQHKYSPEVKKKFKKRREKERDKRKKIKILNEK